ncbi:IS21 family transposase [Candidatus Eisenbacteria bacterium]|uniref:IS21 family transposase n=1 Tax=Eiseniibacteriota bacterium TaxID=2212470 RepID=A0ABV6YJD8_UNCEI
MIPPELEANILRLYHAEKWRVGTIAMQLGVHHSTVRRVLAQAQLPAGTCSLRPSIGDPFIPFIVETLKKYPKLCASRLYQMVKERGYPGGPDHFRTIVARHRPRAVAEAYLRLRTLPGEQAQVDWGHFGKVTIGQAVRPLMAFVMVLSYSRQIFLRFFLGSHMANFLRGHVAAFAFFGGVARILLYDNLRSAVLERRRDAIRFHPTLLELAKHYRFEPRPVAQARGNEKGRVERAIRFARDSFFAAREWSDLEDLNAQARGWSLGVAADRTCPEDRTRTVREVFEQERPRLLALPENPFPAEDRAGVRVGKTPYVRFDLNDYSIPHTHVRRTLEVVATQKKVRVLDGPEVLTTHDRCWDRGQQIEDPAHLQALVDHKRQGREHRGLDRLYHGAPSSQPFFVELAHRGGNLGATTVGLLRLLDRHGARALEEALAAAVGKDVLSLGAVRQILDQRAHAAGKPPPITVALPDDPRVRDLIVEPHALTTYDHLEEDKADDQQPGDDEESC